MRIPFPGRNLKLMSQNP
jgi:hypothetical protein